MVYEISYEMSSKILFKMISFFLYNDYKPTILFLTLSLVGYTILRKIQKNIMSKEAGLAKHNMYKTYIRKTIQKNTESKLEKSKLGKSKLKSKNKTVYYYFMKEEWPKIRQEFKNYHYKELLQYLSLRWYIVKNDRFKLEKYKRMDTLVPQE